MKSFCAFFTARVLDRFSVARNFEEKENMRSNEARVTARDSFTSWQLVLFRGRMTQKDTNQRKISGQNKVFWGPSGGLHGSVDSILASRLTALGSILSVPKFFFGKSWCCWDLLTKVHRLQCGQCKKMLNGWSNPSSTRLWQANTTNKLHKSP